MTPCSVDFGQTSHGLLSAMSRIKLDLLSSHVNRRTFRHMEEEFVRLRGKGCRNGFHVGRRLGASLVVEMNQVIGFPTVHPL